MPQVNLLVIFFSVLVLLILYLLILINNNLRRTIVFLVSIDHELFHVAQEQNPDYGICNKCGQRAIVQHVVPQYRKQNTNEPDIFYCHRCSWLSGDVMLADERKHYKDRSTRDDIIASTIGPG